MRIIDLSHPLEHGVPTIPGFPLPEMSHHITYEESRQLIGAGRCFAIDRIGMIGGSSTYMDAPRHFDPEGSDIADLDIARLIDLEVTVVPRPRGSRREYHSGDFEGLPLEGRAVLLATGKDQDWATPAYEKNAPYLGGEAAHLLVDAGVSLVGIDAILIDDHEDTVLPEREAHASLLSAGIPIIENMTRLEALPTEGARLTAVPPAVRGVGSFPVRVFALCS
ncbi:MAG: cyclase family protein [Leucobacter sp.]